MNALCTLFNPPEPYVNNSNGSKFMLVALYNQNYSTSTAVDEVNPLPTMLPKLVLQTRPLVPLPTEALATA